MKRVLISAIAAGALLGQLGAVEIYKDGDKSFGVFGVANAVVGYGYNFSSVSEPGLYTRSGINDIIYGIQGNSRIGINFTVGKVFGAALIGANEQTFRNSVAGNSSATVGETKGINATTPGFRQLYAGYDFGDAGKLLAGKNELVTSMGGFSSSIFDTESGLNGFGGASTSTRRFQIAYSVAGFTASISENDVVNQGYRAPLKSWQKSIPRISLGYEYNQDGLRAKVAASYAYANEVGATTDPKRDAAGHKNIFLVTAGVKPTFGDQYVSALLTYGLNAQLAGETKVAFAKLGRGYGNVGVSGDDTNKTLEGLAKSGDFNTYAAMLEYGVNLTNDLAFKVGLGYQFSSIWLGDGYQKMHSYAGFVQLPYKVGGGFSIIPQVGYLGTTMKNTVAGDGASYQNTGSVLAEVLFKIAF